MLLLPREPSKRERVTETNELQKRRASEIRARVGFSEFTVESDGDSRTIQKRIYTDIDVGTRYFDNPR